MLEKGQQQSLWRRSASDSDRSWRTYRATRRKSPAADRIARLLIMARVFTGTQWQTGSQLVCQVVRRRDFVRRVCPSHTSDRHRHIWVNRDCRLQCSRRGGAPSWAPDSLSRLHAIAIVFLSVGGRQAKTAFSACPSSPSLSDQTTSIPHTVLADREHKNERPYLNGYKKNTRRPAGPYLQQLSSHCGQIDNRSVRSRVSFGWIWCNYLSRFAEKQRYACQATPLLKRTEHDKKKDIRERNRTGRERERRKETAEKQ